MKTKKVPFWDTIEEYSTTIKRIDSIIADSSAEMGVFSCFKAADEMSKLLKGLDESMLDQIIDHYDLEWCDGTMSDYMQFLSGVYWSGE